MAEFQDGQKTVVKSAHTVAPIALNDPINPGHYKRGGIEAITVIEDWELGYHLGNAVKYICRAGRKNPATYNEDLKKALWYLARDDKRELTTASGKINVIDVIEAWGLGYYLAAALDCIHRRDWVQAAQHLKRELERTN